MSEYGLLKLSKIELARMVYELQTARAVNNPSVKHVKAAVEALQCIAQEPVECFVVLLLNSAHKIIKTHVVTKGILNQTVVHPREVFVEAILYRAKAIIIAHNHPGGTAEFSEEDIKVNKMMWKAGTVLGIPVLDSIIVTPNGGYISAVESSSFGEILEDKI